MEIPASLLMSSGMHTYVCVKASLHAADSAVFGLNQAEKKAITKRFHDYQKEVVNGILVKGPAIEVVNALGELGYKVVGTTGEAEIVWTMQRDL